MGGCFSVPCDDYIEISLFNLSTNARKRSNSYRQSNKQQNYKRLQEISSNPIPAERISRKPMNPISNQNSLQPRKISNAGCNLHNLVKGRKCLLRICNIHKGRAVDNLRRKRNRKPKDGKNVLEPYTPFCHANSILTYKIKVFVDELSIFLDENSQRKPSVLMYHMNKKQFNQIALVMESTLKVCLDYFKFVLLIPQKVKELEEMTIARLYRQQLKEGYCWEEHKTEIKNIFLKFAAIESKMLALLHTKVHGLDNGRFIFQYGIDRFKEEIRKID